MQLLVLILKRTELFDELMHALANRGITGATILDGTGMAEKLVNMEDIPMFGALRSILAGEEKESCKVMLFAETEDQVEVTRSVIKKVVGDIAAPNTGIMFAMPITYVEGLGSK
ncbi:MAG: hypothetical protein J6U10_03780 [Lachnospiraceae bacterium]|nr:hypothetical protein [Lachnospiraceae bacterium]MBP5183713.1 hypothetical protein [Lachnospiraceae bacterium]